MTEIVYALPAETLGLKSLWRSAFGHSPNARRHRDFDAPRQNAVSMDNESDEVKEGHSVDALALRGDEGRGTLR